MNYATRMYLRFVLLPCLALCAVGIIACKAAKGAVLTDSRCYSAKQWGPADDAHRPCVAVKAVGRDVVFRVLDANGTERYSGYVVTDLRHINHVKVVQLWEDGSFTWKARSVSGRTTVASVGNLQD